MKVKSLVNFSGVPKGATGEAEHDGGLIKITWNDIQVLRGIPFKKRKLEDWFNQEEFNKYIEVLEQ